MLSLQVRQYIDGRIIQDPGDAAEVEAELTVDENAVEPLHVARRVNAITGRGALGWRQQTDLVVMVQCAHADVRELRELAYRVAHGFSSTTTLIPDAA